MIKYLRYHASLLHNRLFNKKTIILLAILWIVEDMMLQHIISLSIATEEKVTPAVYVFLQSYSGFLLIFFLEVIVFYMEVPFMLREQIYVLLRTGRIRWYLDQGIYILISSGLIILSTFFICLLRLHSILKFDASWDKILGTLALTDAGKQFDIVIPVPYKILNYYNPIEAIIYSLVIGWGIICLIGMLMFVISLISNRRFAIVIITSFVLIFGLQNYYPVWVKYLVPLSWMQISELGVRYSDFAPNANYVYIMLPIIIVVVFGGGAFFMKKIDFEWMEEE